MRCKISSSGTANPIPESYQAYEPTPHERPTWDLTSVLHVVRPDRGYFGVSPPGTVSILEDGESTFAPGPDGRDRYLTVAPEDVQRVREVMAALVSQPPFSM